ncbi:MAG: hypothetical protein U9M90_03235 [Patescibacteria group bacterium]|nr:hypothetical protein [Patescibacteria group bacterium]
MRYKIITLTAFFSALAFVFPFQASASTPTGGLWGQFSKRVSGEFRFEKLIVGNIDYENFDQVLKDNMGQQNNAEIYWRGGIYADKTGNYDFRISALSGQIRLRIDGKTYMSGWGSKKAENVYLTEGWHSITVYFRVGSQPDSKICLFWTPPEEAEEIIPKDHMSYQFWSDSVLTIPSDGSKKKIGYVAAGVGSRDESNPGIEIDMPSDVLTDDVWIVWFKNKSDPASIIVKNENIGLEKVVPGVNLTNPMGGVLVYEELFAQLPSTLIDDNETGRLNLSFRKSSGASDPNFYDGIAVIVPFIDNSKPEGQLSIRMVGASAYKGASPVLVFPTDSFVNNDIRPLFLFADGETKSTSHSHYRPNYMVMLSGMEDPPSEKETLKNIPGAKMLVPEGNPINMSNPDTWYPCFGREGTQFDVISSKYNYAPNYWTKTQNQYVNNEEGEIDSISIPKDHDWIAFQYYGSSFAEDGVTGSGESGSITGGGLFSTVELAEDECALDVSISGNGTVKSDAGSIDCPGSCEDKYADGTAVKLTAEPKGASSFIKWTGDCSGTNLSCTLTINEDKSVQARFTVPGICGNANNHSSCIQPVDSQKCFVGSPVNEDYNTSTKTWTWQCDNGGDLSPFCKTTQNCRIHEIVP